MKNIFHSSENDVKEKTNQSASCNKNGSIRKQKQCIWFLQQLIDDSCLKKTKKHGPMALLLLASALTHMWKYVIEDVRCKSAIENSLNPTFTLSIIYNRPEHSNRNISTPKAHY